MGSRQWLDLLAHDRAAVEATLVVTAGIEDADRRRPTPCAQWTLDDLKAHMTGQQIGFADAARGGGQELTVWAPSPTSYAAASHDVLEALATPGLENGTHTLPEVAPAPLPARTAVRMHLLDNAVHGWDVAVTLGVPFDLPDDVVDVALDVAERIPVAEGSRGDGRAFAVPMSGGEQATPFERVLRLVGRDPQWRPPAPVS